MDKEKLRYVIAKEISEGNTTFSEMDFGVTEEQFDGAVNFLSREGYLIGIKTLEDRPDLLAPKLTEKGENYLKENGTWSKAYKTIKEVRDWIK